MLNCIQNQKFNLLQSPECLDLSQPFSFSTPHSHVLIFSQNVVTENFSPTSHTYYCLVPMGNKNQTNEKVSKFMTYTHTYTLIYIHAFEYIPVSVIVCLYVILFILVQKTTKERTKYVKLTRKNRQNFIHSPGSLN